MWKYRDCVVSSRRFAVLALATSVLLAPGHVTGQPAISYYRFVGEHRASFAGHSVSLADDIACDGFSEVVIGAPLYAEEHYVDSGAVYLVSAADLATADAADRSADLTINLGNIADQPRSWKFVGEGLHYVGGSVASNGDVNGDGCSDLLIGARADGYFRGAVYLISGTDLVAADRADGAADGVIEVGRIAQQLGSWELLGEESLDNAGRRVTLAGDVSGDKLADLLVGAPFYSKGDGAGAAYLLSSAAMSSADASDGVSDGRIALASVANQLDSWKIVGENPGDRAGAGLSSGHVDPSDQSDLIIIGAPGYHDGHGAVYLIATSDLFVLDGADGVPDGVIDLGNVAGGASSWKLVGESAGQNTGADVAAGDVDGDGLDELVISSDKSDEFMRPSAVYIISMSDLPAADAADGAVDGVVGLVPVPEWKNSFKLVGGTDSMSVSSGTDVDGDGSMDILVGHSEYSGVDAPMCSPGRPGEAADWRNGAVYLISGASLPRADAADGARDAVIELTHVTSQDTSWALIGEPLDLFGGDVQAGDVDGDGTIDLILGSHFEQVYLLTCGTRSDTGSVLVVSGAYLAAADAQDGRVDRRIHLAALGTSIDDVGARWTLMQPYDNLVVVSAPDLLKIYGLEWDKLVNAVLSSYGDIFDFLVVITDLPPSSKLYPYAGLYVDHSQHVAGIGKSVFLAYGGSEVAGERLRGVIHLSFFDEADFATTLRHEIMHAWANFVIQTDWRPHWGFSSANGVLGGFDLADLVHLGNGRYTAGRFEGWGNDAPYSPIELYLAGMIPPEQVPDLWVANDGRWLNEWDDSGNRLFAASNVETWSIERIVREYGARTPDWLRSQRAFRAAAILVVDNPFSASATAQQLRDVILKFTYDGDDGDDESYNFWEATGGRATLAMDLLGPATSFHLGR